MARDRQAEAKAEDVSDPQTPEKAGPPDLLILDAHTGFTQNGAQRTWEAGVPITNPLDIADLADQPGKRYRLIKD